jgi:rRNA maturation protein Nop10
MSMPMLPAIGIEKLKKGEKEVIFTVLDCAKCGEETTREYKEGDTVFTTTDEACTKCGGSMIINQIFVDIVKKK